MMHDLEGNFLSEVTLGISSGDTGYQADLLLVPYEPQVIESMMNSDSSLRGIRLGHKAISRSKPLPLAESHRQMVTSATSHYLLDD